MRERTRWNGYPAAAAAYTCCVAHDSATEIVQRKEKLGAGSGFKHQQHVPERSYSAEHRSTNRAEGATSLRWSQPRLGGEQAQPICKSAVRTRRRKGQVGGRERRGGGVWMKSNEWASKRMDPGTDTHPRTFIPNRVGWRVALSNDSGRSGAQAGRHRYELTGPNQTESSRPGRGSTTSVYLLLHSISRPSPAFVRTGATNPNVERERHPLFSHIHLFQPATYSSSSCFSCPLPSPYRPKSKPSYARCRQALA